MSADSVAPEKHRGVWVFVEQKDGIPRRVSHELLSEGRVLADRLGVNEAALLIGEGISKHAEELVEWGADQVIIADYPVARHYRSEVYTYIIVKEVLKKRPEILLVGATCIGRDLAPRVAARLRTGCVADATQLSIDQETREIVATKPFYGRNLMADIICPHHKPQIVTVRPGVMELCTQDTRRRGSLAYADLDLKEEDVKVKVLDILPIEAEGARLGDAEKIVAGGMGLGSKDGFDLLKELGRLLGAEVGATSLPVDAGWVSEDRKIGQTGKTVKPRLYMACGISGAVQHTAGIMNSELIVAINKDPKAEIFDVADYGIVDDLDKVLPAIIDELK